MARLSRTLRPLSALLLTVAIVLAAALVLRAPSPPVAPIPDLATPRGEDEYVRAAHWFGDGWAVNFWNTDLERRAERDFRRIREDGFNTLVLVVPWPGFAAEPNSGELDENRLERLQGLLRLAHSMQLQTVLRLSYAWDSLAEDGSSRLLGLWTDDRVYQGWLAHLESLWNALGDEPNLQFGFFSWEDLWAVVSFSDADPAERLLAAQATGFQAWLRTHRDLGSVSERFGVEFAGWQEVPIPARREPAFKLFLEFIDSAWIQRFFLPAQQRFPRLSMEIRVDADPVWNGDELLDWHSHESAWNLPGADWTTIYWSPAMGGLNQGETLTPEEAAQRLEGMLGRIKQHTGARQIFIGQFLAEDFTPGYERNGRIPREQLGRFLDLAREPLYNLAGGYGLWAWMDYRHDAIANPEFHQGLDGWKASTSVEASRDGVRVPAGEWLSYSLTSHHYHTPGGPETAELCVEGRSSDRTPAKLQVEDAHNSQPLGEFELTESARVRCLSMPVQPFSELRFSAESAVVVRSIHSSGFVQPSGIRDLQGSLKPAGQLYQALNRELAYVPALHQPLFEDGWMGHGLSMTINLPAGGTHQLQFRTHLPAGWPATPTLSVSIDGDLRTRAECLDGALVKLPLPAASSRSGRARLRIDSSMTHTVEGDQRALGCVISELRAFAVDPDPEPRKAGSGTEVTAG
jgi:hypothetical protein